MTADTVFYECKSNKCNRSKKPCILVMPNAWYDEIKPKNCPFIEQMDGDNSEWEQISRVTITRKY